MTKTCCKRFIFLLSTVMLFQLVHAQEKRITFTVVPGRTAQTIENFGGSGCWFSEGIGRYWRAAQKDSIAMLLFSKELDNDGRPLGIGLSAWRFNIGGGTAEQGDSSG